MRRRHGFSLIELIIYFGIAGVLLAGLVSFVLQLGAVRASVVRQQRMLGAGQWLTERLQSDIRSAQAVTSLSSSVLELAMLDPEQDPVRYEYANERVWLGRGASGACSVASPCPLTDAGVDVTDFTFLDLSVGDSVHVGFEAELEPAAGAAPGGMYWSLAASAEVRSR